MCAIEHWSYWEVAHRSGQPIQMLLDHHSLMVRTPTGNEFQKLIGDSESDQGLNLFRVIACEKSAGLACLRCST